MCRLSVSFQAWTQTPHLGDYKQATLERLTSLVHMTTGEHDPGQLLFLLDCIFVEPCISGEVHMIVPASALAA